MSLINPSIEMICRHFVLHPPVQKLYPGLADVPLSKLENNEEFHTQAYIALMALDWIVNNLDNDELLTTHLQRINIPNYYVDYIDRAHQLDASSFSMASLLTQIEELIWNFWKTGNYPPVPGICQ